MNTLSKAFAQALSESKGQFITVTFKKKDGTVRTMNCRTGVTKHLRGGACTVDTDKYLIVYDLRSKGYRSINKDTIMSISMGKQKAVLTALTNV